MTWVLDRVFWIVRAMALKRTWAVRKSRICICYSLHYAWNSWLWLADLFIIIVLLSFSVYHDLLGLSHTLCITITCVPPELLIAVENIKNVRSLFLNSQLWLTDSYNTSYSYGKCVVVLVHFTMVPIPKPPLPCVSWFLCALYHHSWFVVTKWKIE